MNYINYKKELLKKNLLMVINLFKLFNELKITKYIVDKSLGKNSKLF